MWLYYIYLRVSFYRDFLKRNSGIVICPRLFKIVILNRGFIFVVRAPWTDLWEAGRTIGRGQWYQRGQGPAGCCRHLLYGPILPVNDDLQEILAYAVLFPHEKTNVQLLWIYKHHTYMDPLFPFFSFSVHNYLQFIGLPLSHNCSIVRICWSL